MFQCCTCTIRINFHVCRSCGCTVKLHKEVSDSSPLNSSPSPLEARVCLASVLLPASHTVYPHPLLRPAHLWCYISGLLDHPHPEPLYLVPGLSLPIIIHDLYRRLVTWSYNAIYHKCKGNSINEAIDERVLSPMREVAQAEGWMYVRIVLNVRRIKFD